jgi:hypothetical protein
MQLQPLNWNVSYVQEKALHEIKTDYRAFLAITADYVQSDEADMVTLERAVLPNFALTSASGYDIRRDWGLWPVCFQSVH